MLHLSDGQTEAPTNRRLSVLFSLFSSSSSYSYFRRSVGPSTANLLKQLIDTRWDDDADADDEEEALVRRCVGRRLVDDFVVKVLPLAHRSVGRSVGDCSIYLAVGTRVSRSVGRSAGLPFSESVRMVGWSVGRLVGGRSSLVKEGKMTGREGAGKEGKERAGREESRMRRGS